MSSPWVQTTCCAVLLSSDSFIVSVKPEQFFLCLAVLVAVLGALALAEGVHPIVSICLIWFLVAWKEGQTDIR